MPEPECSNSLVFFFFLMIRPPPRPPLFPYPTLFRSLSPGSLDALQVIEAVSRLRHRTNGLLRIIFAVADPGQPNLAAGHENVTRGLQQLLLALRSEEHTSELQSLTNLVCRLLLEKKK